MKSHTVKSNAKRAARQLAGKYPGMFEPGEPSPAPGGWFPVINWTDAPSYPHAVPEEVRAACVIANGPMLTTAAADVQANAVVWATGGGVPLAGASEAVHAVLSGETAVARFSVSGAELKRQRDMKRAAEVAASVPPPVKSSDEEIRARRAERRERVEREKVEGKRLPNGSKAPDTKAAKLLAMMKDGATMEEMSAATEWQHHTIRGFIAGTLRKRLAPLGKTISTEKIKGKPTLYLIADKEASA